VVGNVAGTATGSDGKNFSTPKIRKAKNEWEKKTEEKQTNNTNTVFAPTFCLPMCIHF
jgi:hypothetical protein